MTDFLDEAARMREHNDPAQGFVLLYVAGMKPMYGYVETAEPDMVQLMQVRRRTRLNVPVCDPYLMQINPHHILTARYANLHEVPEQGSFR
jgi:hypothetical protein